MYLCGTEHRYVGSGELVRYTPISFVGPTVRSELFIYRYLPTALVTIGIPRPCHPRARQVVEYLTRGTARRRISPQLRRLSFARFLDATRVRFGSIVIARDSRGYRVDLRSVSLSLSHRSRNNVARRSREHPRISSFYRALPLFLSLSFLFCFSLCFLRY